MRNASPTTPTRSMIRHAIHRQTGPPRQVDARPCYGNTSLKCLSQGHNIPFLVQKLNREWTILQLPTCAPIH